MEPKGLQMIEPIPDQNTEMFHFSAKPEQGPE